MASALLGLGAELLGGLEGGAAAAGAAGASAAGAAEGAAGAAARGGIMSEVSGLLDKGIQFADKLNPFLNVFGGMSGSNLAPPELHGHDEHPDQYNWE
jgi:hypothetical protein